MARLRQRVKWSLCVLISVVLLMLYVQLCKLKYVQTPVQIIRYFSYSNVFRACMGFLGLQSVVPKLPTLEAETVGINADRGACQGATLRLGNAERGNDDGGWNVCSGKKWPPPDGCVVYSFGSNYDFTFERSAASMGCEVHVWDPTMPGFAGSPEDEIQKQMYGITFHDAGLSAAPAEPRCERASCLSPTGRFDCQCSWRMESVESAMQRLGHIKLELLKLDVEGAEWEPLDAMTSGKAPFLGQDVVRQLLVELHFGHRSSRGLSPERGQQVLRRIRETGLKLWSRDENTVGP